MSEVIRSNGCVCNWNDTGDFIVNMSVWVPGGLGAYKPVYTGRLSSLEEVKEAIRNHAADNVLWSVVDFDTRDYLYDGVGQKLVYEYHSRDQADHYPDGKPGWL